MKVNVVIDPTLDDQSITLTCRELTPEIERLINDLQNSTIIATRRGNEFPLAIQDVLFFETDGDLVFAHLPHTAYETRYRLYELEQVLPAEFVRISKSSIANIRKVESINRGLATSVREIVFHQTHKIVYVSRKYYPSLKERMEARSL